jgi:membrane protein YqaA with SNARE-associated domain
MSETELGFHPLRVLSRFVRGVYDWVLHWADTPYAMPALGLLAFAEASFFPVPPDVLLIAMTLGVPRRAFYFAGTCAAASIVGGLAGYGIGALLWAQVSHWFFAYIPGFTEEAFARVASEYNDAGWIIVFVAGFSPIPYKIFTIASGVTGMPVLPFLFASAVSRSARFFLVAGLIWKFGEPVKRFIDRYFNWLALAFCVLLAGGFVVVKWLL